MPRIQLLAAVILALVVTLAIACNGDDNGDGDSPGDGSATATATPPDGETPDGETPDGETPHDGTITPAPDKTPLDDNGDIPTGSGQPSTSDATPGLGGTPATEIDITVWREENYPSVIFDQRDCVFNPGTFIATCPGFGDYSVDPPLTGEDISCQSFLVNDEPVVIFCRSQVPLTSIYYEIQR